MKRVICGGLALIFVLTALPFRAQAAGISAASAVVIEASSRTALFEKDAHTRRPPASTTKILTALIVLERADPERKMTVSANAAAVEGSQLGLTEGDILSVGDLLHILLMKSGNDAAVTLAENLAGSVSEFAEWMNQKAAELGLEDSHFTNPHGLPDDNHYTTAADLALIAAAAMENERFREIVHKTKAKLDYKGIVIGNSNKLLFTCEGACGIKTGYTKEAGRCLVSAAQREGGMLICVTLSAPDDWNDHRQLYDTCFPRVERYEALPAGQYTKSVMPLNGEREVTLTNASPLFGIKIDGKAVECDSAEYLPAAIFAPVRQGQIVGSVALVKDGRVLSRSYLYATEDVGERYGETTRLGLFCLYLNRLWEILTFRRGTF